jgi:2'-5' RNA ligase
MRSVLIFPAFDNMNEIQEIRKLYDPVYSKVEPHISLVFPFPSDLSKQAICDFVKETCKPFKPFKICLSEIINKGDFIFLVPSEGREKVIELHKALYSEAFSYFLPDILRKEEFIPHITIGKRVLDDEMEQMSIINKRITEYQTIIEKVSVEIINTDEESVIESEIELI